MPTVEITVRTKATRQQVLQALGQLPRVVAGGGHGTSRVARILAASVGLAVLDTIHQQFLVKSDGGTDVTGLRWRSLRPRTIRRKQRVAPKNAHKILREKDLLVKSLKPPLPGPVAGQTVPRVKYQIFRLRKGSVIVGSDRPYIRTHVEGTRLVPQRRPWPAPGQWNSAWWRDILQRTRYVVAVVLVALLKRAGK